MEDKKEEIYKELRSLRIREVWDSYRKEKKADYLLAHLFKEGFTIKELEIEIGLVPTLSLLCNNYDLKSVFDMIWDKTDYEYHCNLVEKGIQDLWNNDDILGILEKLKVSKLEEFKKQYKFLNTK